MPHNRAVAWFEPGANTCRPKTVYFRMTTVTTASKEPTKRPFETSNQAGSGRTAASSPSHDGDLLRRRADRRFVGYDHRQTKKYGHRSQRGNEGNDAQTHDQRAVHGHKAFRSARK